MKKILLLLIAIIGLMASCEREVCHYEQICVSYDRDGYCFEWIELETCYYE